MARDIGRQKAEEVLSANHIVEPPVPITSILETYGIRYVEGEFKEPEIAGVIDAKKRLVYVDINDSPARKAFTLAMALGHFEIHPKQLEENPKTGVIERNPLGVSLKPKAPEEAKKFAAFLLVPEKMLENTTEKYGDLATVGVLADLFGVTQELIRYRLHVNKKE